MVVLPFAGFLFLPGLVVRGGCVVTFWDCLYLLNYLHDNSWNEGFEPSRVLPEMPLLAM